MAYHSEKLTEKNVLTVTLYPPIKLQEDANAIADESAQFATESGGRIFRVIDFRSAYMDFSAVVEWLAHDTQPGKSGNIADADVQGIFVGNNEMVEQMVTWLKQQQYGGLQIPFFKSMDDALAHIDEVREA